MQEHFVLGVTMEVLLPSLCLNLVVCNLSRWFQFFIPGHCNSTNLQKYFIAINFAVAVTTLHKEFVCNNILKCFFKLWVWIISISTPLSYHAEKICLNSPTSTIYKTAAKQIIDQDPGTTQLEGNSTHLNNNNRCENKTIV